MVFSRNNTACAVTLEAERSETLTASSVIMTRTSSRQWGSKDAVGWLCVFTFCTEGYEEASEDILGEGLENLIALVFFTDCVSVPNTCKRENAR